MGSHRVGPEGACIFAHLLVIIYLSGACNRVSDVDKMMSCTRDVRSYVLSSDWRIQSGRSLEGITSFLWPPEYLSARALPCTSVPGPSPVQGMPARIKADWSFVLMVPWVSMVFRKKIPEETMAINQIITHLELHTLC